VEAEIITDRQTEIFKSAKNRIREGGFLSREKKFKKAAEESKDGFAHFFWE